VVLGIAIFIAETSLAFHLEPLLVSLVVGLFVENLSARDAEPLLRGIESSSFPVYALFFAHAGASLDLSALVRLWPIVLVLVPLRGLGMWLGARLGATWAGSEEVVRRHVWMGFLAQAGVSLALSVLVARAFPGWGEGLQVVVIAMIAVQQIIGPPGLRYALDQAGEIGARDRIS
jgi:Kef-type K+ transport system membrane component KefB